MDDDAGGAVAARKRRTCTERRQMSQPSALREKWNQCLPTHIAKKTHASGGRGRRGGAPRRGSRKCSRRATGSCLPSFDPRRRSQAQHRGETERKSQGAHVVEAQYRGCAGTARGTPATASHKHTSHTHLVSEASSSSWSLYFLFQ